MERESDSGQDEWVNAWAAYKGADAPAHETANATPSEVAAPTATPTPMPPQDQLALDIAAIVRRRDALNALPVGPVSRTQPLTLVASRTDRISAIVGGVLVLVILTVFGAAAAMGRLY